MALEKRAEKKLARTHERLQQIDREIAGATEQLLGDQEARSLAAVREQHRVEATQLQQSVSEANRRLDSAEVAYQELLIAKGLSPLLSTSDAIRKSRKTATNRGNKRTTRSDRLKRWIKGAKKMIRHIDGECYTNDPHELLASLEFIFTQLRDQEHGPSKNGLRSNSGTVLEYAKKELKRLDKLQRNILRRAKVHDVFELESALEEAKHRAERAKKWKRVDDEISVQIDAHEDGEEVRELLEMYSGDELRRRAMELEEQRMELEERRRLGAETLVTRDSMPASVTSLPNVTQAELERKNQLLAELDLEISAATEELQRPPVTQPVVVATHRKRRPTLSLSALTNGAFDNVRFQDGQFFLENKKRNTLQALDIESETAGLAWLALQLRLAAISQKSGNALPLVVFADEVLSNSAAESVYQVLVKAAEAGMQILLLAGSQRSAGFLKDAGAAVVRIGLNKKEQPGTDKELAYAA